MRANCFKNSVMPLVLFTCVVFSYTGNHADGQGPVADPEFYPLPCTATVTAEVVALDQTLWYNRFGAFDPNGMIYALASDVVSRDGGPIAPGNARLRNGKRPRPLVLRVNEGDCLEVTLTNLLTPSAPVDGIATRSVGMHCSGLEYANASTESCGIAASNSGALAAAETGTFVWYASKTGIFPFNSLAGSTGGEGDGGSQSHGLFGVIAVEPAGAKWYRSQVTNEVLQAATIGLNPDGTPLIDYDATDAQGRPLLAMVDATNALIASDLTAIITNLASEDCANAPPSSTCGKSFREFTIVFHDETDIRQAYPELDTPLFKGVRDKFAINYGTGGLGAEVIAVRRGEGPAKDCGDCKFEEFFLESWANGDPAMPVNKDPVTGIAIGASYEDDPSNVYHSYMGDAVRFRNIHFGAETHVFHLHAHQWLFAPRDENSTYLDSQSISPGTAYTYEINYGGSGNRNFNPGDSIFHCHLYPHFAQGMWSLWRTHDVFEDGTSSRNLVDGEIAQGTPVPALVPIPGNMIPPLPTVDFPGYPHYIAGQAGHRPPQAPLEYASSGTELLDGGLGRHRITSSTWVDGPGAIDPHYLADPVAARVAAANTNPGNLGFARKLLTADLELLPTDGTPLEQVAMSFHAGNAAGGMSVMTEYDWPAVGYPSFDSAGNPGLFLVNGRAPQPGAPYADPCPDNFIDGNGAMRSVGMRSYKAAYIQFDMTINQYGWHDRQARIAVLNQDVMSTLDGTRAPQPLFFRANSGDCIEFQATNLIPNNLNVDDYQIFTPTDTLGQHIHLVKFDVTASDGGGNGWNYEDGTFSPEEVRERIEANNAQQEAIGGTQILTAKVHPWFGEGPGGEWIGAQTTTQRWWADPLVNNNGDDRTIRSVFTHDHFGPSSHQQHGLYALLVVEPTDSVWTLPDGNTLLGTRDDGGPTNWAANILAGVQGADSMREFVFETGDWMPVYHPDNTPVNATNGLNNPESIQLGGGAFQINYRNEPVANRNGPFGEGRDLSFSSLTHGDPFTPLARAYPGDPIKVGLVHGAQEEQHSFGITGNRWLQEGSNPNSGYTNSQEYGISEHFEMYFTLGEGLRHSGFNNITDYMYHTSNSDGLMGGMWGLLRSYNSEQPDLARLPNNPQSLPRPEHPLAQGECPTGPGSPPIREVMIQAWMVKDLLGSGGLLYNQKFGLRDPDAMVFIHADEVGAVMAGQHQLEPLVIRANAGDCIEVILQNMLPLTIEPDIDPFGNQTLNRRTVTTAVGLNPQLLAYDIGQSDGAAIGVNPNTLVSAGQFGKYAWYAGKIDVATNGSYEWTPVEFGVTNLRSMGDFDGHYAHGLFGVLVVEPEGSQWFYDGVLAKSGYEADILDVDGNLLFTEYVLQYQDEFPTLQTGVGNQRLDEKVLRNLGGYNYHTEPLWARMGIQSDTPWVTMAGIDQTDSLSSITTMAGCAGPCLDPATPGCDAEAGQLVMFRVAQASGNSGAPHTFGLSGHNWQAQPWTDGSKKIGFNPNSEQVASSGLITAQQHRNILVVAGGAAMAAGDYIYRSMESYMFSGGCWGVLRVSPHVRLPALPVQQLNCTQILQGVLLDWVNSGGDYITLEILRDGVGIATLPGSATQYLDQGIPAGTYVYSIIATNAELPSDAVTCNAGVTPLAASGFICTASGLGVSLSWQNSEAYESLTLTRDGVLLTVLPGGITMFDDFEVGYGAHSYGLSATLNSMESDAVFCDTSVEPPAVASLTATEIDPCEGTFDINWLNFAVYDQIIVTLDGLLIASLPGDATTTQATLGGPGSGVVCVTATASGVNSAAVCTDLVAPGVPTTGPSNVQAVVDPLDYSVTVSWTANTQHETFDVLFNGSTAAVLAGDQTSVTLPLEFPGTFTVCVSGTNICSDTVPAACAEGVAPPLFERGDTNSNGGLDIADVAKALTFIFAGGTANCLDAYDANDDGHIDISDPIQVVLYLFANGAGPAGPIGSCGADLTEDTLSCESFPACP